VDGHARANRHKPSGIASTQSILKWHLVPAFGTRRLDAITSEQVQRLKLALSKRAPKTVSNVLTVLSSLLKKAVECGELERLPCVIKLLRNPKRAMGFHDFDQYERLLMVARKRGGERVLCLPDGSPITRERVIKAVRGAQRIAGIETGRAYLAAHVTIRTRKPRRLWRHSGDGDGAE
jgi:hypothetical protein